MSNLPTTSVHFDQTPLYAEGSTHVASSKVYFNNERNKQQWDTFVANEHALGHGHHVLFMIDHQYRILRATTNVQQAMGFSAEDLASIMPHYVSFSFPSDTSLVRHHLFTIATTLRQMCTPHDSTYNSTCKHRVVTAFGRYAWFETVFQPGAVGEPSILLSCCPIDPPTNAENDWTCAEEHFSKSFNIQLDYTTRNVVWISPASTLLGYTSLQLLWVEASELIHPRDRDRFAAAITSVQETAGQRIALIVDVLHGQGYYVTASVLMEAGIMMSDDQVHPWRFMLLNFSVLNVADNTTMEAMPSLQTLSIDGQVMSNGNGFPHAQHPQRQGDREQPNHGHLYDPHSVKHDATAAAGSADVYPTTLAATSQTDEPNSQQPYFPDLFEEHNLYNWHSLPPKGAMDEEILSHRLGFRRHFHNQLHDYAIHLVDKLKPWVQSKTASPSLSSISSMSDYSTHEHRVLDAQHPDHTHEGADTDHSMMKSTLQAGVASPLNESHMSMGKLGRPKKLSSSPAGKLKRSKSQGGESDVHQHLQLQQQAQAQLQFDLQQNILGSEESDNLNLASDDEPKKKKSVYRPSKRTDKQCEVCGKTESPEWRRGPNGNNSLCNACGIRFAKLKKVGCPPQEMMVRLRRRQSTTSTSDDRDDDLVSLPGDSSILPNNAPLPLPLPLALQQPHVQQSQPQAIATATPTVLAPASSANALSSGYPHYKLSQGFQSPLPQQQQQQQQPPQSQQYMATAYPAYMFGGAPVSSVQEPHRRFSL